MTRQNYDRILTLISVLALSVMAASVMAANIALAQNQETDSSVAESELGWMLTSEPEPALERETLRLSLRSDAPVQTDSGPVRPVLVVECKRRKISISLNWQFNVGRHSTRMRTDFDNQPHRSAVWSIDDDFQTVTSRGSDISFIKRIMRHEKLRAEITPRGKPIVAEFSVAGLSEVIGPLRKSCRF